MKMRQRLGTLMAASAVCLAALTACESGGSDKVDAAKCGVTGEPISVGWVNADTGSYPQPGVTKAAEAAVDYVNCNGGIGGRPLELVKCLTDGTPAMATKCANDMVSKDVPVVLSGIDLAMDAAVPVYAKAKLSIFSASQTTPAVGADPQNTILRPAFTAVPTSIAAFYESVGVKKVTVIYPNLGPVIQQAYDLVEAALSEVGIESNLSLVDPAIPDVTSAITAAKSAGSDGLFFSFQENDCTNAIRTAESVGWTGDILAGSCSAFIDDLGPQAEGVYTMHTTFTFAARKSAEGYDPQLAKEFDTFESAMKKFGEADLLNLAWGAESFSTVMTFADIVRGVAGTIDATSIGTALSTYKGRPFLGLPQDCASKPAPGGSCGGLIVGLEVKAGGTQALVADPFDLTQPAAR